MKAIHDTKAASSFTLSDGSKVAPCYPGACARLIPNFFPRAVCTNASGAVGLRNRGTVNVRAHSIKIIRADAVLPESTAILLGMAWVSMLSQTRAEGEARLIFPDSTSEIFSAVIDGEKREGKFFGFGNLNTAALCDLATKLLEYSDAPQSSRSRMAKDIEKAAAALLRRLEKGKRKGVDLKSTGA